MREKACEKYFVSWEPVQVTFDMVVDLLNNIEAVLQAIKVARKFIRIF